MKTEKGVRKGLFRGEKDVCTVLILYLVICKQHYLSLTFQDKGETFQKQTNSVFQFVQTEIWITCVGMDKDVG